MTTTATFNLSRDRDAWYVIRGYVYQVDRTIYRWLELEPHETLELERGEDIDVISSGLEHSEELRILEQIKHLEANITLNSSVARGALANYNEHRASNPDENINFRFITTANAGLEKDPPWPSQLVPHRNGIEAWNSVRGKKLEKRRDLRPVAAIRRLLGAAKRPESIPSTTWDHFTKYIAVRKAAHITALIEGFEWSTGSKGQPELEESIRKELIRRAWASSEDQAHAQYNALFVHVFNLLSRKGVKSLTTKDREGVLQNPALSDKDSHTLDRIRVNIARLQSRVDILENRILSDKSEMDLRHKALGLVVSSLAEAQGTPALALTFDASIDLVPPPNIRLRTDRSQTVDDLTVLLQNKIWAAIFGASGTGKTELALLLARRLTENIGWISLRDMDPEHSLSLLRAAFSADPNNEQGINGLFRRYPRGTATLVIDDTPRFEGDGPLCRFLVQIATFAEMHDAKLITTSAYSPSARILARFEDRMEVISAPSMSSDEVKELLAAYSAPNHWANIAGVRTLLDTTSGHPELLVTAIRTLKQNNWQPGPKEYEPNYAFLNIDVASRVLSTVSHADARHLLRRLALAVGPLTPVDVGAIAAVNPPLAQSQELLVELDGLWVQRSQNGKLLVCPLAKSLTDELPGDTFAAVHDTLACRMLAGKVSPRTVILAIQHWLPARESNKAAVTYYHALSQLADAKVLVDEEGLLDYWGESQLPDDIGSSLKLCIRALQVQLHRRYNRDFRFVVGDILELASRIESADRWALVAVIPVITWMSEARFGDSCRLLVDVLCSIDDAQMPDGSELITTTNNIGASDPVLFFWHLTSTVSSREDIEDWLAGLERLASAFGNRLVHKDDHYESGSLSICDKVWLTEERVPITTRDWHAADELLIRIGRLGRDLGMELLWSSAERARIIVAAEYTDDIDRAIDIAEAALANAQDARSRFLLEECIGRNLLYKERRADARRHLRGALEEHSTAYSVTRVYALVAMARSLEASETLEAVRLCKEALMTAKEIGLSDLELCKLTCEYAIAIWLNGKRDQAASEFERATTVLLTNGVSRPEWRDFLLMLGHAVGYMFSVALTGKPPIEDSAGGEYVVPFVGLFQSSHRERHLFYKSGSEACIYMNISQLMQSNNEDERAAFWAEQAFRVVRQGQMSPELPVSPAGISLLLGAVLVPRWTRQNDLASVGDFLVSLVPLGDPGVVIDIVALPLMLSLLRAKNFGSATKSAQEVAGLVDEIEHYRESRIWKAYMNLLDLVFVQSAKNERIIEEMGKEGADVRQRLLPCLHAALASDSEMSDMEVIGHHLVMSGFYSLDDYSTRPIVRECIVPFLAEHWIGRLESSPFAFRTPKMLADMLKDAQQLLPAESLRSILRDVLWGMGVSMSNFDQGELDWLKESM